MSVNVIDGEVTFNNQLQKQRENCTTRTTLTNKTEDQSNKSTKNTEEHSEGMDLAKELETLGEERVTAAN